MRALALISLVAATLTGAAGGIGPGQRSSLLIYPPSAGVPRSSDYLVRIRTPGGPWHTVPAYQVTVDLDTLSKASMVLFGTSGAIQVSVRKASGTISSARIRPASLGIRSVVAPDRRAATFTLPGAANVSFEVNRDTLHNLHVFANPIDRSVPKVGPRVIYFGPGVHTIPGDHVLAIPSNTTVYLAGGSVVRGALSVSHAHNVVVRGPGILQPSAVFDYNAEAVSVLTDGATDIGFRDFTILGAVNAGFDLVNSRRIAIANVKELNFYRFSDGIDVQASSEVLVEGAFLRTSDDSMAVYASTPWGAHGSTRDVTVRNSVLWADVAHPILVGTHGNPSGHDVIARVAFDDVDILEHDEANERYQGAMAVDAGDRVSVRNVQFEDIRVDDFARGQLLNVKVFLNPDYNKAPGTKVDGVLFRNVTYRGSGEGPSQVEGFDRNRSVTNVMFENLRRNGPVVLTPKAGNIEVGRYVSPIVFRKQANGIPVEDSADNVRYAGRWTGAGASAARRGLVRSTASAGSRVTLTFSGREARVLGETSPTSGRFIVNLDGVLRGRGDAYSGKRRSHQVLFDTGVIAPGRHRLELQATGRKNMLSDRAAITVQGFQVVP